MFMYRYMKQHKNDGHGISKDTWRRLKYGNFKTPRIVNPDVHSRLTHRIGSPTVGVTIPTAANGTARVTHVADTVLHGQNEHLGISPDAYFDKNRYKKMNEKKRWEKLKTEDPEKYAQYMKYKKVYKDMKKKIKASATPTTADVSAISAEPQHGFADKLKEKVLQKWKDIRKDVRHKLKKMGYAKGSDVEHGIVDYIQRKLDKKRIKKGYKRQWAGLSDQP